MAQEGTRPMDDRKVMECVGHIRAAARLCEQAGALAQWATLLGVSDLLLATIDQPTELH